MALISLYPTFGVLFIILGSIITIWFIIHVEKGFRFSGVKSTIAIILLATFYSFGIQFLLISFGAMG
ncbi:MAG: hypothetical protein ACTSQI_12710 [Candidatus Helarchaeota archaeon]